MATHNGSEGIVKIGANTVAEVTGWSLDVSAELTEDTQLSDTWKSYLADVNSWTASIECHWDETDTNGQEAMTIGASVDLSLLPEGATTGDVDFNGTAIINSISRAGTRGSTVTVSFTCTGTGALTQGTAA